MSSEKVPQILIVDVEAAEARKESRREHRLYALSHLVAVAFLTFLLTAFTTLCVFPTARHMVLTTPIPGTSTSIQEVIKKRANLHTRDNARNIIFPLYIDPGNKGSAWQPIYDAAKANKNVFYTIIINPNNGPTTGGTGPDPNYKAGLAKLSAFSNIQVLGYVPQGYGARAFEDVMADVNTWASWGNKKMYGNALSGIFFDEGPADEGDLQKLAKRINTATKKTKGFSGIPFVVQNPGILPPPVYFKDSQKCDVTIILENTYAEYLKVADSYNGIDAKYGTSNSAFSFIFAELNQTAVAPIKAAITPMMKQVSYLFITNVAGDIYGQFGSNFGNFSRAMSTY